MIIMSSKVGTHGEGRVEDGLCNAKTRGRIAKMLGEKDVHVLDNVWIRRMKKA